VVRVPTEGKQTVRWRGGGGGFKLCSVSDRPNSYSWDSVLFVVCFAMCPPFEFSVCSVRFPCVSLSKFRCPQCKVWLFQVSCFFVSPV